MHVRDQSGIGGHRTYNCCHISNHCSSARTHRVRPCPSALSVILFVLACGWRNHCCDMYQDSRFRTEDVEPSSPEFISATASAPMPSDGLKSGSPIPENLLRRVLLVGRLFSHLECSSLFYTRNGKLYWRVQSQGRIPHWKKRQDCSECIWQGVYQRLCRGVNCDRLATVGAPWKYVIWLL